MGSSSSRISGIEKLVCAACRRRLFNFDSFQEAWLERVSYSTNWKDIQEANEKGCAWCNLIFTEVEATLRTLRDEHQTQFQGTRESIEQTEKSICEEEMIITMSFQDDHGQLQGGRDLLMISYTNLNDSGLFLSAIPICTASDDNAALFIPARPLVYDMSSPDTFQFARDCLDECSRGVNGHENCPKLRKSSLPTRVLDCQNPDAPRLKADVNGIEEPYAALSYVWGEDQPQRTVFANLDRYINFGLDMQATPRTIKDAIRVTCELNLRYLWIDTYCIIQDSPEDKAREISQMRGIYQNAYFTIIAAKTPKVSVGFLQDCPPPNPTFCVPFYCPNGKLGTMTLSPRAKYNMYEAAKEPINARGWCLQERILAPRALVYASHTLQYLCQRGLLNIGSSSNQARISGIDRLSPQFFDPTLGKTSVPAPDQLPELTKLWHRVLQDYTPRGLTAPADKLNAISGVADEFQHNLKSRYLAGMWEHHLLGDLCWTRSGENLLPRPSQFRAPSWSWAAVNGVVYNPGAFVEPQEAYHCTIIDCQVELADKNSPFGEVRGGSLKLEAHLKRTIWNSSRSLLYEAGPDGELVVIGGGHGDTLEEINSEDVPEEVWMLPLVLKTKERVFSSRDVPRSLIGILLKPLKLGEEESSSSYRRIGSFRCALQSEIEKGFDKAKKQEITIF